jgi:hypothetical protein
MTERVKEKVKGNFKQSASVSIQGLPAYFQGHGDTAACCLLFNLTSPSLTFIHGTASSSTTVSHHGAEGAANIYSIFFRLPFGGNSCLASRFSLEIEANTGGRMCSYIDQVTSKFKCRRRNAAYK